MKKSFVMLGFLFLTGFATVQAQSLFDTVYKSAIEKVNDSKSSQEIIDINQFEVTALNYLQTQVKKRALKKDSYFYDSQAVNLKSFVDDFLYYLNKSKSMPQAKRTAIIACYREASLSNPLFNDTNKERVYCYVNDTKTYTPFSLDTDWDKAYNQATAKIKTIIK